MKYCPICEHKYLDEVRNCAVDGATLLEVPTGEDPYIGKMIKQRFRVLRKLGEGGMGTVYLAEQVSIRKKVALKILNGHYAADEEFVKRFQREARLAAGLSHPNIVTILDFDQIDDGGLFIAMEYVDGNTLGEIINQEGPLELHKAMRFGAQLADGLAAAHRMQVIHRDIKPQNIMIVGGGEALKIMDFGIARSLDAGSSTRLTRADVIMGTPEYMAPEQVEGTEATEQTDIYATGIVLYEMLTGKVPFKAPTPGGTLIKQVNEAPPSLETLRKEIPAAVQRVVMQALEKKPGKRQRKMEEIADELRRASASIAQKQVPKTILATRNIDGGSLRKQQTGWKAAGAIVIAALLLAAGYLFFSSGSASDPGSTTSPTAQPTVDTVEQKEKSERELAEKRQAELQREADEKRLAEQRREAEERTLTEAKREAEEQKRRAQLEAEKKQAQAIAAAAERKQAEEKRKAAAELAKSGREKQLPDNKERIDQALARLQERTEKAQKQADSERLAREKEQEKLKKREPESLATAKETAKPSQEKISPAAPRPTGLSEAERTRIRTLVEQKLRNQGLLKVSEADRWGVGFDLSVNGVVTLNGTLRDQRLRAEAVRLAGEVPGVVEVRQKVQVSEAVTVKEDSASVASVELRSGVEQKLRNRGLLKASESDRWGVTVETGSGGVISLRGALRDQKMRAEAIRLAREVPGVTDVRQSITVSEGEENR